MEKKFKCKDEVVYRFRNENANGLWTYGIFSHYQMDLPVVNGCIHPFIEVLPYAGNEYLVGTDDEPAKEIVIDKGCNVMFHTGNWNWCFGEYQKHSDPEGILVMLSNGANCLCRNIVPFSKFNPDDMEATKKEILTVRNGKLIKANKL